MRQSYLVFGRATDDDGDADAAWWPLYQSNGPQLADSAEMAIARVKEQLMLGGENGSWIELAAVPAMDWTSARFDGAEPRP